MEKKKFKIHVHRLPSYIPIVDKCIGGYPTQNYITQVLIPQDDFLYGLQVLFMKHNNRQVFISSKQIEDFPAEMFNEISAKSFVENLNSGFNIYVYGLPLLKISSPGNAMIYINNHVDDPTLTMNIDRKGIYTKDNLLSIEETLQYDSA